MNGRWTIGILAVAIAAAVFVGFVESEDAKDPQAATPAPPPAGAGVGERPKAAVERCSTRSEAGFPGGFTSRRNLVVGPLSMVGAGGRPEFVRSYGGQKFQLLVRNGHRVTIELPPEARPGAGLAYGPLPRGEVTAGDAHRAVSFIACERGENSNSSADGKPVTFWSGGVLAESARCVPLRVFVDGAQEPMREVIRLGVRRCG